MIKYLQKQEYSSRTKVFVKEKVEHVTFNFTLENQVHRQGEYFNDKWVSCIPLWWCWSVEWGQTHFKLGYMTVRLIILRISAVFIFYISPILGGWMYSQSVTTLCWMTTNQMKKNQWGFGKCSFIHCFDWMKALHACSCLVFDVSFDLVFSTWTLHVICTEED